MKRIKERDLLCLIEMLNKKKGTHKETHNDYHLSTGYGGYKLEQTAGGPDNPTTGTRTISASGYGTKRELYNQLTTLLNVL